MNQLARKAPSLSLVTNSSAGTEWDQLPEVKRELASDRERIVKHLIDLENQGGSMRAIVDNFIAQVKYNRLSNDINKLALKLGRKDNPPSRATLYNWIAAFKEHGIMGLIKKHKGSERKIYGWEAVALRYYSQPQKPGIDTVALWLRRDGFDTATNARVRSYIKSMPANLSENSRKRLGAKEHRDTQKSFVRRDTTVIPVGYIYQGDGHTIDAYLGHPQTGKSWRPELTVWIDVRSRYIVGWFISESESALSTLFALSHALMQHDHVPAMLHIDNGAGFKSKMVNDKSRGFYARFSIETIFSIPGNPKGKGQVERWFRTLRDQHDKMYDTYCGHDMAPDVLNKIVRDAKANKYELPTLQDYTASLATFIEQYNNTVHSALDGKTPAQLWATLERVPIEIPAHAICWPQKEVNVKRQGFRLDKREYMAPELQQYNGTKLVAEYNVHDDSIVRVLTQDERWICDAKLVNKAHYLPASRIEENEHKRLKGQTKRLQSRIDENEKRVGSNITHDQVLDGINNFTGELDEIETPKLEQDTKPSIDLLTPLLNEITHADEQKSEIFLDDHHVVEEEKTSTIDLSRNSHNDKGEL